MKSPLTVLALALLLGCSPNAAAERSSKELALLGQEAWSAFTCSVLAGYAEDETEPERLFQHGLQAGREFFEAAMAEKISEEDLSTSTPMIVLSSGQGPSVDFILGRVFQSAVDYVSEEIYRAENDVYPDKELAAMRANRRYRESNCTLIGR